MNDKSNGYLGELIKFRNNSNLLRLFYTKKA